MSEPPIKKYRREESEEEDWQKDDDNDRIYVPVKERRKQKLVKLGMISHKTSLITIFGHKHKSKISSKTLIIFI